MSIYNDAIEAIKAVFQDFSKPLDEVKQDLKALQSEIDNCIEDIEDQEDIENDL